MAGVCKILVLPGISLQVLHSITMPTGKNVTVDDQYTLCTPYALLSFNHSRVDFKSMHVTYVQRNC